MKYSTRPDSVETWTAFGLGSWALVAIALVMLGPVRCVGGSPAPLLTAGEQALVGSYKLDHVLLAPGKLVVLPNSNPMFQGMGDTPEQTAQKGWLTAAQAVLLQKQDCTVTILADHSFVVPNLPSADLSQVFLIKGTWSLDVYHVFDTQGYRISLKCVGYEGPALHAKFFGSALAAFIAESCAGPQGASM